MKDLNSVQQLCQLEVDYSGVAGGRILPFQFVLDVAASDLAPGPGENQRFCYNVTGVGEDNSTFADLSHFVFGICEGITEDQLENVTVVIDGLEQKVIIGDNVEIFNPPSEDPPTGCPGLKFDFGLNKVSGKMTVCFELNVVYPVGPTNLCLFGARETKSGLNICGPVCNGQPVDETCPAVGYVPVSVCSPVTVTPFVNVLPTTTICCGPPIITSGTTACPGVENGTVTFNITQNICVGVPIEVGATSEVGNPFVVAGTASGVGCPDCEETVV